MTNAKNNSVQGNFRTRGLRIVGIVLLAVMFVAALIVGTLIPVVGKIGAEFKASSITFQATPYKVGTTDFTDENNLDTANAGTDLHLLPGQSFQFKATIHPNVTEAGAFYSALTMYFGILGSDNQFDTDKEQYFSIPEWSINVDKAHYDPDTSTQAKTTEDGDLIGDDNALIGYYVPWLANGGGKPITEDLILTMTVTLSANASATTSAWSFGVAGLSQLTLNKSSNVLLQSEYYGDNGFEATNISVNVRELEEDNTLKSLVVGSGANTQTFDSTAGNLADNMEFSFEGTDLTNFSVTPTSSGSYATMTISVNGGTAEAITSGAAKTFDLTSSGSSVAIIVTPEKGLPKTYALTVKLGYVRLSALASTATSNETGVDKTGIYNPATFDADTFGYTAYLPSDVTEAKISASVLGYTDDTNNTYGASKTIALSGTGCTVPASFTSGGEATITNLTDGATVTLTVTAQDTSKTKAYTITYSSVSVDTSIDSFTVTDSKVTGKTYESKSDQTTQTPGDGKPDYLFELDAEGTEHKGTLNITPTLGADAKITVTKDGGTAEEYSNSTVYEEGQYTITVTAPAGNSKDYKVILSKPANHDATLKTLAVKAGSTTHTFTKDATDDTKLTTDVTVSYNEANKLSGIMIGVTPTANDANAKLKVYVTDPMPAGTPELAAGTMHQQQLNDDGGKIYILVTAEDGFTTSTYTITVTVSYVRLETLSATVTNETEGVTKTGYDSNKGFSPDDKGEYTIYVPSDYTEIKIVPAIKADFGSKTDIVLTANGCKVYSSSTADPNVDASITTISSASELFVKALDETSGAPTLKLTATAQDGTTTMEYTLKFEIVSVNANLKSVSIKGASGKVYDNDAAKATEKSVDYYFLLADETADAKGEFTIELSDTDDTKDTATGIKIGDDTYDSTATPKTQYAAGTYEVAVTAEAGNVKKYTVMLSKQEYLTLTASATYRFMLGEESGNRYYRRTYEEKKFVHGVDDLTFEEVILGEVQPRTTVSMFLQNIVETQRKSLKFYNSTGKLIYANGAPAEGITESALETTRYAIGTGWKIELAPGDAVVDTVYVSVLGDLDGNGNINATDIMLMNMIIKKLTTITDAPKKLACYVVNKSGTISAMDVLGLNYVIKKMKTISDFYYQPPTTT